MMLNGIKQTAIVEPGERLKSVRRNYLDVYKDVSEAW